MHLYLLTRKSQYALLLLVACFPVPVELPASHDGPSEMHVALEAAPLLLDVAIENASAECVEVVLVRSDWRLLCPCYLFENFGLEAITLLKLLLLPHNRLEVVKTLVSLRLGTFAL